MPDCRFFGVRRFNPFDGVLQVVESADARAYSPDGRVWQVQVAAERPDHTWRSLGQAAPIRQFFRFGLWDADDGMQRVPANPVLDIGAMTRAAQALADTLSDLLDALPFTLIDRYECWTTDRAGHPVACLATTEDRSLMPRLRVEPWQSTRPEQAVGAPAATAPHPHPETLERAVRERGPSKGWFERLDDGSGRRVDTQGNPCEEAVIDLPPLGLTEDWPVGPTRQLVHDYLDWQAPRLLLLEGLDDALRHRLELAACRRADELASVYRLIPRIVDTDAIAAARVEARLRRSRRQSAVHFHPECTDPPHD